MKAKKIIPLVFFAMIALNTAPVFADKAESKGTASTENKLSDKEVTRLTNRLIEIRDMDKSTLTADQKRDLRKEVRAMRDEIKKSDSVIVIPLVTVLLIVIILLLI